MRDVTNPFNSIGAYDKDIEPNRDNEIWLAADYDQPATPVADKDAVALRLADFVHYHYGKAVPLDDVRQDVARFLDAALRETGWRLSRVDETPRFDHDGTYRHHHHFETGEPVWWQNVEHFGGEKRHHIHWHRAASVDETPPDALREALEWVDDTAREYHRHLHRWSGTGPKPPVPSFEECTTDRCVAARALLNATSAES